MKPKENTIDKIDRLCRTLGASPAPLVDLSLTLAVQKRCHNMNIHKAKVVYFKRIKLMLTQALELTKKQQKYPTLNLSVEINQVERELRALLDASNG